MLQHSPWNGGRDSVEAFLEYCKLRNFRCDNYGVARMCQVVGNWFGGTLSIGTVANIKDEDSDWVDNGIYVVKNWEIIKRIPDDMEEQMYHDKIEMLLDIDKEQPERDRLGAQYINAPWVDTKDLKPGDKIYCRFHEDDRLSVEEVIGVHKHPSVDKEYPYIGAREQGQARLQLCRRHL